MRKVYNFLSIIMVGFILLNFIIILFQLIKNSLNIPNFEWQDKYFYNVFKFTIIEAFLSSFVILFFAIPLARAFYRNSNFLGRELVLKFFNISFVMPVIVVISGLISLYGSKGIINQILSKFGLNFNFYGMIGILMSHLVLNLPFITRLILNAYNSIPNELVRIASQLGLESKESFWYLELPIIKNIVLKAFALSFVICFTSFSIILTLGGSIKYTTLEVAIFQALKIDFNISYASLLSLIQFTICSIIIFITFFHTKTLNMNLTEKIQINNSIFYNKKNKLIDYTFIIISIFIIFSPLAMVIINGINYTFWEVVRSSEFLLALNGSFKLVTTTGIVSLFISTCFVYLYYNIKFKYSKSKLSSCILTLVNTLTALPLYVIITGIISFFYKFIDIFNYSIPLMIGLNSIALLPFITNTIIASLQNITNEHRCLGATLGLNPNQFFQYVIWPEIRKSLGLSLAITLTLSLNTLGVINLLGSENIATLPLILYHKINTYQLNEASVIALILLIISGFLFWLIENVIGGK